MALFGLISSAQADLVNPSFEDPALDDGGWTNTVTGWTVYWGDHNSAPPAFSTPRMISSPGRAVLETCPRPPSARQCAWTNSQSALYQNVGVIQANTLYTLTIATGSRLDGPIGEFEFALRADVFNDNNLADLDSASTPGANIPAAGTFVDNAISFNSSGSSWAGHNLFVVMYTPVRGRPIHMGQRPLDHQCGTEPSGMALLVTGLAGLLAYAWRKRK